MHRSDFEDGLVETPGRDDLGGTSQRQLNRVGFLEVCWLTLPTATRTLQAGRSRKAPPALAHKAGSHERGKSASFESGGPHRAAVFVSGGARTRLKRRLIASWHEIGP